MKAWLTDLLHRGQRDQPISDQINAEFTVIMAKRDFWSLRDKMHAGKEIEITDVDANKRKLPELLKEFYVREINMQICSFFDSGWDVRIGDHINGFTDPDSFENVSEMEKYLREHLEKLPPLTDAERRYIEP